MYLHVFTCINTCIKKKVYMYQYVFTCIFPALSPSLLGLIILSSVLFSYLCVKAVNLFVKEKPSILTL